MTGPFPIAVAFSEPVTGFELEDLVVGNGSVSELQGNNATYTAMITRGASGTVTVDIAAGAAEDSAGNPSAAADQFSITADLTPVPALPLAGAIVLALLSVARASGRRGRSSVPPTGRGRVVRSAARERAHSAARPERCGLAAGLRVGSAPGRAGPGEPDADRGPRTASAPAAGGRTPCPARGAPGGA